MDTTSFRQMQLPEDVLYNILQIVAQNEMPCRLVRSVDPNTTAARHDLYYTRVLGWIRLGHVSRLWRRVTLHSRSLWAGSIGTLPSGLHEMMERAGSETLLTIHLYIGERRSVFVDMLSGWLLVPGIGNVNILPRIRALHVGYLGRLDSDDERVGIPFNVIKGLFSHALPNLCHFELSPECMLYPRFAGVAHMGHSATINAPLIKELSLQRYFVRFNAPALVSLSINLQRILGWSRGLLPPAGQFIELIRACASSLERVDVEGMGIPLYSVDGVSDSYGTVHLPRLKSIKLYAPPQYTEDVLRQLSYPPDALTRVDLRGESYLYYGLDVVYTTCAKYPRQWAAFRMHDDDVFDAHCECYLDLYSQTPALLAAIDNKPWTFPACASPQVSFRISSNDDRTAKDVLRELDANSTGVQCASFALKRSTAAPLAVPTLAAQAQTIIVEGPYEDNHSVVAALSHPMPTSSPPDPATMSPMNMPRLKHLYLLPRIGGSNKVDLARLTAELGQRESWDDVQLHVDAALRLRGDGQCTEDAALVELLVSFRAVHWRECLIMYE